MPKHHCERFKGLHDVVVVGREGYLLEVVVDPDSQFIRQIAGEVLARRTRNTVGEHPLQRLYGLLALVGNEMVGRRRHGKAKERQSSQRQARAEEKQLYMAR